MHFLARLTNDGDEKNLHIEILGEKIKAVVDDREYDLELTSPEPEVYLFRNNGRITEARATKKSHAGLFDVQVRGKSLEIEIIDPRSLRPESSARGAADGTVELRSMMPGKVVRILASEGSDVAKGDGVLVVEAMKMQNEIKAPRDGKVVQITAVEGSTVGAGDLLAIIE